MKGAMRGTCWQRTASYNSCLTGRLGSAWMYQALPPPVCPAGELHHLRAPRVGRENLGHAAGNIRPSQRYQFHARTRCMSCCRGLHNSSSPCWSSKKPLPKRNGRPGTGLQDPPAGCSLGSGCAGSPPRIGLRSPGQHVNAAMSAKPLSDAARQTSGHASSASKLTCKKADVTEAHASVSMGSLGSPCREWLRRAAAAFRLAKSTAGAQYAPNDHSHRETGDRSGHRAVSEGQQPAIQGGSGLGWGD